jgi:anion-transporting  ArsA/GET3 family ATPase
LPSLLDRDLVVVTGKGGVGKSTVAAALALAASRRGLRTVLAEVGGRVDAARLVEAHGVDAVSITPRDAMEEYLHVQLPRAAGELLARSGTFAAFVEATPGMNELLTIGKVWELAADRRRTPGADPYDVVILDAPASGHGLALLGAPQTFSEAARVGPIHRQAGLIAATLADPAQTAVVAVTLAEEMPVNETLELRAALVERMGLDVSLVVANGIAPDRLTADEAAELAALGAPSGTPVAAALWAHDRARSQRAQLRRLRSGLDARPVRLPFAFGEPDPAALAELLEPAL